MTINFSELQNLYNEQMNLVLSSAGLTTKCLLNFGVTKKDICPNCIFDPNLKKSANKYKTGGPQPFIDGRICPYCNGVGFHGLIKVEAAYFAIIWDYKYWINKPINIQNPTGMIQTICDRTYFSKIKQCKDMTVIYSENNSNPLFKLVEEPNPVGLGDNNYLFCNWEKIGTSSITVDMLPKPPIGLNIANYANVSGLLLPVGTAGGPSAYGTYDQTGNAQEWTGTRYGTSSPLTINVAGGGVTSTSTEILKGGFVNVSGDGSQYLGFRTAIKERSTMPAGIDNYVLVTDKANKSDPYTGFGQVYYDYYINKYETTMSDWCDFVNSVAAYATGVGVPVDSDTYGLVHDVFLSGVTYTAPTGFPGYYTFTPSSGNETKPVTGMDWLSAARYCNWLHNSHPTGLQNAGTTERGTYTIDGITTLSTMLSPTSTGTFKIPTAHEWYKAGFYKSANVIVTSCGGRVSNDPSTSCGTPTTDNYWKYATQSDATPGTP